MLGVIVNTATVLAGSLIGLILKKGLNEKLSQAVMTALGLFTIYIGIHGALQGQDPLVVLISAVAGVIIGTAIDLDGLIARAGDKLGGNRRDGSISQGLMTGSLLFCVGAMTVVGSLQSGLNGDHSLIFTKSAMDFISSMMLAASLGIGVMFAAGFVLLFQGGLVLLAGALAPVLTEAAIADLSCVGSLFIIALGLNLIGVTNIKVANGLPAVLITPAVLWIWQAAAGLW